MEITCVRMSAYLLDLDTIEVLLSKQYYQGISPSFYLRDVRSGELSEIQCTGKAENQECHIYYFDDIEMDCTRVYQIVDHYGLSETLQYTKLVKLVDFDALFEYEGEDLGATYYPDKTVFKVWAPTALEAMVCIEKDGYRFSHHLEKQINGVFVRTVYGYYDNCSYTYLLRHHDSFIEATDPYSYSSSANGKESKVIDITKCNIPLYRECLPIMKSKTEAILYETSVRDFIMHDSISSKNKGKFLGMVEKGLVTRQGNKAGFDYLLELGVTHIQLMPIYDFATVDENHPLAMYNWGYDPMQYNVPEGSYCTNPNDGYSRIMECRKMVSEFHRHGLRVVMDVVYNHMYDVNASAFERIVPGYYFRKRDDGALSNGSWCGNDLNTTACMVRKYIVDMSLRFQKLYGMDGYRFDLMGIVDVDTLNAVYDTCYAQDKNFIIYGEGWNMDTALVLAQRGMQDNHASMKNIGFFNDQFRDTLKGASSGNLYDRGYFAGNMYHSEGLCTYLKNTNRYSRVDQSINYGECHDNATMYDKFNISNGEETEEIRKQRQLLMNCACIISQGIPFLHSGQEFFRSKQGIENTYNTMDKINCIDWDLLDKNKEYVEKIKQVIRLRLENEAFKYATKEDVEKYIQVENIDHQMIKYTLHQDSGTYSTFDIYINGSDQTYPMETSDAYEILYSDINMLETVEIHPLSMVILGKRRIEV